MTNPNVVVDEVYYIRIQTISEVLVRDNSNTSHILCNNKVWVDFSLIEWYLLFNITNYNPGIYMTGLNIIIPFKIRSIWDILNKLYVDRIPYVEYNPDLYIVTIELKDREITESNDLIVLCYCS